MRWCDERRDGHIRFDHAGQWRHFARRADARLHDGKPMKQGIEPRKRQRHANVVVQIAFGRQHATGIPAEERREKVLRRGFAAAASDTYDGTGKQPAVLAGNCLKRP